MRTKPRPRLLMMSFSLVALLVLILSACGSTSGPSSGSSGASSTPVKGGTWIDDLFEEPDSFIPNGVSETFADMVDQSIWTPLFVGDASGHINPGLVSEMPSITNGDVSADAKTWTFKLKPNLLWSDGQPLDARDVDYTWRLWDNMLPGQSAKTQFTPASTTGYNLIQSATVSSDNLSITFHLKSAFAPFLSVWTDGLNAPMPAHVLSQISPDKILSSPENLKPSVSSGPFMVSESVPGDHFTVVRNPKYYQAGLPYLDKIVFQIRANQDTILKDLQAGSIDSAWFLDVSKTIAYQRLSNYKLVANPHASNFEAMYFNFLDPILGKDLAVRQAMAMDINHQNLIDAARRGEATPLCTDHGKSYVPGYQADVQCTAYDPKGAATLLQNDGWALSSTDNLRHKNGQTLEFTYATTANNIWRSDDEAILQSEFKTDLGIKLDITNYPAGTFFGPYLNGTKWQLAEFEDSFTYDADDESLLGCDQFPPTGSNFGRYCNQNLQKLYSQEEGTFDQTARQNAFNQEHQIYLTDFPFVTLYGPIDIAMDKVGANNYMPGPMGASETIGVQSWWCTNSTC